MLYQAVCAAWAMLLMGAVAEMTTGPTMAVRYSCLFESFAMSLTWWSGGVYSIEHVLLLCHKVFCDNFFGWDGKTESPSRGGIPPAICGSSAYQYSRLVRFPSCLADQVH